MSAGTEITPGIEEALRQLRTAIKLIEAGCPNTAQDWAYRAADSLQAENERRRANTKPAENGCV